MKHRIAALLFAGLTACGTVGLTGHQPDRELRKADRAMKAWCGPDMEQAGAWREANGEIIGSCFGR